MSGQPQFDLLIIGSGEAGKNLAWTMGKTSRRTAVVGRKLIGGSCPNIACLPSKNIIHSAKVAELARRGAEFGVMTDRLTIDMAKVYARKRRMVSEEVRLHLDLYKANNAELIMGEAHFVAAKTVEVMSNEASGRVLAGDQVVLNVGTHAAIPDVPGVKTAMPMTNVETLELDRLPEHLIVLGAGLVGLELAQAMRRFGSQVTIIESGLQLVAREDLDIAAEALTLFQDEGIEAFQNTELLEVEGLSGQRIRLRLCDSQGERMLDGSDLLVAIGRVPNTRGLGLEKTGVETDDRGYVSVNERLQTSALGIWAMGECAGSPHFTHVATDDFRVVRDNLKGLKRTTQGRLVPFCMFTDPELARVGLNESEAQKQAIRYRLATISMGRVRRTVTLSETRGVMKALIGAESDEILGFTAFGTDAGEMLSVVQTAMLARLPYTAVRDVIFAHPTMAEGLTVLFGAAPARSRAYATHSRQ